MHVRAIVKSPRIHLGLVAIILCTLALIVVPARSDAAYVAPARNVLLSAASASATWSDAPTISAEIPGYQIEGPVGRSAGPVLAADFEVWRGSQLVWSGYKQGPWEVGNRLSVTPPRGTFISGLAYTVRVWARDGSSRAATPATLNIDAVEVTDQTLEVPAWPCDSSCILSPAATLANVVVAAGGATDVSAPSTFAGRSVGSYVLGVQVSDYGFGNGAISIYDPIGTAPALPLQRYGNAEVSGLLATTVELTINSGSDVLRIANSGSSSARVVITVIGTRTPGQEGTIGPDAASVDPDEPGVPEEEDPVFASPLGQSAAPEPGASYKFSADPETGQIPYAGWRACGWRDSKYKMVKDYSRVNLAAPMIGTTARLYCGKYESGDGESKFGFRHIAEKHSQRWQSLADYFTTNWRNLVGLALDDTFSYPDRITHRVEPGRAQRFCYEKDFSVIDLETDEVIESGRTIVYVGRTGRRIMTTFWVDDDVQSESDYECDGEQISP